MWKVVPGGTSGRRVRVDGMAETPLDLTLDAALLTAQLVDFPSESGTEKPLADASRRPCARCRT